MSTILERVVARKRLDVAEARRRVSAEQLERSLAAAPPLRDFRAALDMPGKVQVIAEVKKASPSAGVLRRDFDPVGIACAYAEHGAAAISVLTDEPFFQGKLADLADIRRAVTLPLLRKDFVIDRYQLLEARAAGADAVLLIAEVLEGADLARLVRQAQELDLQPLVELYESKNLSRVLDSGARFVGINNRDLHTFQTRLEHTLELAAQIPGDICLISESGIRNRLDINRLQEAGVRAVLVGETLMRAPDIGAKLAELTGTVSGD